MSRSSKKGPFVNEKLLQKIQKLGPGSRTIIKTWARASSITPEMVGFTIGVHNGREHINVRISEEMVGHKLGEFSPTRKFVRHGGKIQKAEEASTAPGAASAAPAAAPAAKNGKK
ncbi:MAG: 30S ribosomal protein S19 [Patescibacteria group bacterium]|jgi:small subunit ribosomal protein S19